jgi:hypothetical protein
MAYETQKLITTPCPTYGYWYQRFSLGLHKRMGDVVHSDYAVTLEIIKELLSQLDSEWESSAVVWERKRIADVGFLLSLGFLCGHARRRDHEDRPERHNKILGGWTEAPNLSACNSGPAGKAQGRDGRALSHDGDAQGLEEWH